MKQTDLDVMTTFFNLPGANRVRKDTLNWWKASIYDTDRVSPSYFCNGHGAEMLRGLSPSQARLVVNTLTGAGIPRVILANVSQIKFKDLEHRFLGRYYRTSKIIELSNHQTEKEMRNTLLHEVGHAGDFLLNELGLNLKNGEETLACLFARFYNTKEGKEKIKKYLGMA